MEFILFKLVTLYSSSCRLYCVTMLKRYECNLSDELLQKAHAELNEPTDNDERLKAIDALRTRFQEESGLDLIRSDDAFILRFLRVKKFEQERAYQCLVNYHTKRKELPELYEKINQPSKLTAFLDHGAVVSLGPIANDGTHVLFLRPGININDAAGHAEDMLATVVLTTERMLEYESAQINGITVVQDFQYLKMHIVLKFIASPYIGKGPSIMQEAMPVRIKNVRFFNEGLVIDALWSVIRKFVKEKIKQRLKFFGSDYNKLHELCPNEKLPEELEGKAAGVDVEKWKAEILSATGSGEHTDM